MAFEVEFPWGNLKVHIEMPYCKSHQNRSKYYGQNSQHYHMNLYDENGDQYLDSIAMKKIMKTIYNSTYKYTMCLPPKTGTTNWQIAFLENVKRNDPHMKLNLADLIPPSIFTNGDRLFSETRKVDRQLAYSQSEPQLISKRPNPFKLKYLAIKQILRDKTWTHGINARHPYAKIYSAFSQKFEKVYYIKNYKMYKKYGDLMMQIDSNLIKERGEDDAPYNSGKHVASFESFLILITKFKDIKYLNKKIKLLSTFLIYFK